jgi:2-polyprenyl-3-methyl-5-hydroxy-6-metoxy-1,4-benzoquinol methylase
MRTRGLSNRVARIVEYIRGPEVLDVGCAGGKVDPASKYWLHGWLRQRFKVTGIDISVDRVKEMTSTHPEITLKRMRMQARSRKAR